METLFEALFCNDYIVVPRQIAKLIGLYETIILSELVGEQKYYAKNNQLTEDGWFYCTDENLYKNTTLSRKQGGKPIEHLIQLGLLEKDKRGMPARSFYRIRYDVASRILKQLLEEGQTSLDKRDKQECPKGTNKFGQKGQQINISNNLEETNIEEESNNYDTSYRDSLPDKEYYDLAKLISEQYAPQKMHDIPGYIRDEIRGEYNINGDCLERVWETAYKMYQSSL